MGKYEDLELLDKKEGELIIKCKSKEAVINKLLAIDKLISNSKNKRFLINQFIKDLSQNLGHKVVCKTLIGDPKTDVFYENNCLYFKEKETYIYLLERFMATLGRNNTINQYKERLNEFVNFLNDYTESEGDDYEVIPQKSVENLIKLPLVNKAIKIINERRKIAITNINLRNKNFNSRCFPEGNIIINSRSRHDDELSNISHIIFLHEVGHLLHMAITKDAEILPDGYAEIFQKTFRCRWERVELDHRPETFADCFTVAGCFGTEYESEHYLINDLGKEHSETIHRYFSSVIDNYIENMTDKEVM